MGRNLTGAQRRRRQKARRESLQAQGGIPGATGSGGTEELAGMSSTGEAATIQQATSTPPESPWWPELSPERIEHAESTGKGDRPRRMSEIRLEMQAIKDGNPISEALRQRIIYELADAATHPQSTQREKIIAAKALASIDIAHKRRDLPEQLHIHQHGQSDGVPVFMQLEDLRNELANDPSMIDALDYRPHRDGDDYAVEIKPGEDE